jgi:MFS family permease
MLGLLRQRDFRLLWTGETTSSLGSSVSSVALPLVALADLHAGVFAVSLLSAAVWLPWMVVGLPAGAWVDRLPRRHVMVVADLVSLGGFASVPIAWVAGVLTIAQLVVVAVVAGSASVFFDTAYRALLPALVAPEDLLEGNAKLQGSAQVTHVAGPGIAGLIAQVASPVGGVAVNAASFAVSALCLRQIDVPEPEPTAERRQLRREIAEGLSIVWRDPLLRVGASFGCVSNLVLTGYQAILLVFLVRVVGLSSGLTGLLISIASLGGVLGALMARRAASRIGSARTVLWSKLALMPFGLLIPLTHLGPRLVLFVVGSMAVIGGVVAGNVIWSGWVQGHYPAELLGRISTSVQVVNYGAIPLGALIAGATARSLGVRPTLWIMLGGLVISSGVLLLGPLRTMRDLPSRPTATFSRARAGAGQPS